MTRRRPRDDIEPVEAGHLHVEEDEIRPERQDRVHRRRPVVRLADDLDVVLATEPNAESLARERLVVHEHRADHPGHSAALPVSARTRRRRGEAKRQRHRDARAADVGRADREARLRRRRVGPAAHACSRGRCLPSLACRRAPCDVAYARGALLETGARVRDLEQQRHRSDARHEAEAHPGPDRRDAVHDRVLRQRLQDHYRNECIERFLVDVASHGQAIAESDPLNLEVSLEELELVGQRDLLRQTIIERHTQQLAQVPECHDDVVVLALERHRRDGVERVEQEVGIELPAKRRESRLREALLEADGGHFTRLRLAIVVAAACDAPTIPQ